ncbi:MAG: hypothetical protein UY72_C0079G0004 [Candidatus Uhrbacteria bacterium GW2011_GWD2_52_7]|uniref:Helicase/UvrB N-terminal domain-containing protein n=1 Tax=Candidatus Uhrbacteria bacterium GW2011_GWD2_52_7 TaxID=1618989 RepID=A0A0G1XBB2_9BACT|nr:MAG: hypothetical protein UY72_C0079G0004 [Candidatus Uhrbacteria bacterium GW2011_GWD2_52_7]
MSPQIIRRRAGSHDIRRAGEQTVHLLESGFTFRTMSDRLQAGAKAMRQGIETGKPLIPTVGIENREDQNAIIAKLLVYIEEAAAASRNALQPTTRARLVAAARTGKTIVMIRAVSLLGLRTVILAPSTTIVEKTVAEFRAKLPGVPVTL